MHQNRKLGRTLIVPVSASYVALVTGSPVAGSRVMRGSAPVGSSTPYRAPPESRESLIDFTVPLTAPSSQVGGASGEKVTPRGPRAMASTVTTTTIRVTPIRFALRR